MSLNEQITLEEVNVVLEKDRAAAYGITHIPAGAILRGDADTRMRFEILGAVLEGAFVRPVLQQPPDASARPEKFAHG